MRSRPQWSPRTPSRAGACCATGSSCSTTAVRCCPTAAPPGERAREGLVHRAAAFSATNANLHASVSDPVPPQSMRGDQLVEGLVPDPGRRCPTCRRRTPRQRVRRVPMGAGRIRPASARAARRRPTRSAGPCVRSGSRQVLRRAEACDRPTNGLPPPQSALMQRWTDTSCGASPIRDSARSSTPAPVGMGAAGLCRQSLV